MHHKLTDTLRHVTRLQLLALSQVSTHRVGGHATVSVVAGARPGARRRVSTLGRAGGEVTPLSVVVTLTFM